MTHIALLFEVFFRPVSFLAPIINWIYLVLADATRRFLAKCVLSRGASKRLPRSLLEGVGWDAVEWVFSFSRTFASSVFSLQRGRRQIWSKLGFELAS
jgi:hypothetical protein